MRASLRPFLAELDRLFGAGKGGLVFMTNVRGKSEADNFTDFAQRLRELTAKP